MKNETSCVATYEQEWAEGPEGDKQVVAYINDTPDLAALLLELHLMGYVEAEDTGTEQWEMIFTIVNHWRERELRRSAGRKHCKKTNDFDCPDYMACNGSDEGCLRLSTVATGLEQDATWWRARADHMEKLYHEAEARLSAIAITPNHQAYLDRIKELEEALQELVTLKDMHDEIERTKPKDLSSPRNFRNEELEEQYRERKPKAWQRAREMLE